VISSAIRRGQIETYCEVILTGFKNGLSVDMLQTLTGWKRSRIEGILREEGLI
jgi:hypothetical protein